MITLRSFDKWLLLLGFLIVLGIFTLAYVMFDKGGQCALDPIKYMIENNLTIPSQIQINQVRLP